MSSAVTINDVQDLRKLIPLNILSASRFESLCAELAVEEAPRGSLLFRQGDAKNEFVYVLSGTVSLQAGGMEMEAISAGTESARFALAHQIPRKVSAVAKDRVRYIRVDAAYVNQPTESAVSGAATYEVSDIPEDSAGDWVATLLKSPIFQRLPPANLQNILSTLEEVEVKAGQQIIHQDEPGDYYYVIKKGRCALTRKPSRHAKEIKLAELKTCDTFGEDSLISDQPRNVTVTMISDGVLLRLDKENFLKLLKEPVIAYVNMEDAQRMVAQDGVWLDVRAPDAFDEGHLPGAINIPFFKLRMELAGLSRQRKYILVCDTGRVSESAAFLLIRHLFDAYVLKGGIDAVFRDQLVVGAEPTAPVPQRAETMVAAAREGRAGEDEGAADGSQTRAAEADELATLQQRLQQALGAMETLSKENRTLKQDLADANAALAELRGEIRKRQAAEGSLRDQLQTAKEEHARVRAQLEALSEESARLREVQADGSNSDVAALEAQLAELAAARQALQSDLAAALVGKAQMEQEVQALREAQEGLTASQETLQTKIKSLEEFGATKEQQKRQAEAQVGELERQVAELRAVVQEFVDNQADDEGDEVHSLTVELETVRAQANEDVMAMQALLRGAEQEAARLKDELASAQGRLLMLGASEAPGSLQPGGGLSMVLRSSFGAFALALLMVALGAGLLIAVAAGTDFGQGWTQRLLDRSGEHSPASPNAAQAP
jgi:CRP-like cAMP-binding protein